MRTRMTRGLPLLALSLSLLLGGCDLSWLFGGKGEGETAIPGAGLASWRDFVYVLGGRDSGGVDRAEVWMSRIGAGGQPGDWRRTLDLPEGRAFASSVAAGDFLYLVGGEGAAGLGDGTLYALIVADESSTAYGEPSGFTSGWQTSPSKLPFPLSRSSAALDDGRVILAGGRGAEGPLASVIAGRIRKDGSVGQWYSSPAALPLARSGAGIALSRGRLWLACGEGPGGKLSDALSAEWGPFFNGPFSAEASPGTARAHPVLAPEGGGLVLLGGRDENGARKDGARLAQGGAWADLEADTGRGFGPACAVIDGRVYFVASVNGADPPELGSYTLAEAAPDPPSVFPGSGWVRPPLEPKLRAFPGLEIRYTRGTPASPPPSPTLSSPLWSPSSPPVIDVDTVFRFRAFDADGAGSAEVIRSYRVRTVSSCPYWQLTITPSSTPGGLTSYEMTESYTDGSSAPVSSLWIRVSVATRGIYSLRWADASDEGLTYTASIKVSLFEEDFFASVFDLANQEIVDRTDGLADPIEVELAPGPYNLLVEIRSGEAGGSFGLSLQ